MRPLICGMNNPASTRPGHELYPLPEGCTGNALWKMLNARTGATMREYLDVFERRNLIRDAGWNKLTAQARAYEMVCELCDSGRTIVLLGDAVSDAFHYALDGRLAPLLIHPQDFAGCTWRQIPHPSARNSWYNSQTNRELVELLMEDLYYGRSSKPLATYGCDDSLNDVCGG